MCFLVTERGGSSVRASTQSRRSVHQRLAGAGPAPPPITDIRARSRPLALAGEEPPTTALVVGTRAYVGCQGPCGQPLTAVRPSGVAVTAARVRRVRRPARGG